MGENPFRTNSFAIDHPFSRSIAVTPDNNVDLEIYPRFLWVGGAGNLELMFEGDDTAQIMYNVPAGFYVVGFVKRVLATNTTATNILALW